MISIPPDDALAASVFALGLKFGFVRREDVVRWADRRIMEIENPPMWLIDLSLSRDWNALDVISKLKEVGKGTHADAVVKTILGLIPEVRGMSFEAAEALAKRIYDIARHCIDDWHNPLLSKADEVSDNFVFQRDGYITLSQREVVNELAKFVTENRDQRMLEALRPVVWAAPDPSSQTGDAYDRQSLTRVGLSAWIIADGNYADFVVGQKAKFALEFYPSHGLNVAQDGPPVAQHLKASHYRVRAQVVFADANVWVIDAGSFMAFCEQRPPEHGRVGAWVEGEIYLGIDPFFYFEYLHRMDGMPPLTYSWIVREIARETTRGSRRRTKRGGNTRPATIPEKDSNRRARPMHGTTTTGKPTTSSAVSGLTGRDGRERRGWQISSATTTLSDPNLLFNSLPDPYRTSVPGDSLFRALTIQRGLATWL